MADKSSAYKWGAIETIALMFFIFLSFFMFSGEPDIHDLIIELLKAKADG